MDKYFGLRIDVGGLPFVKHKFPNGAATMPCGHVGTLTGTDQKCPNFGKCSAGHGECWVEQYVEPTVAR